MILHIRSDHSECSEVKSIKNRHENLHSVQLHTSNFCVGVSDQLASRIGNLQIFIKSQSDSPWAKNGSSGGQIKIIGIWHFCKKQTLPKLNSKYILFYAIFDQVVPQALGCAFCQGYVFFIKKCTSTYLSIFASQENLGKLSSLQSRCFSSFKNEKVDDFYFIKETLFMKTQAYSLLY